MKAHRDDIMKGSEKKRNGPEKKEGQSGACLSEEDVNLFFKLWFRLLYSVNEKHKIVPPFKLPVYRKGADGRTLIKVKDKLWENPEWIGDFVREEGKDLTEEEKEILMLWKEHFIKGRFIVMRHLKKYSVLMSSDDEPKLYGVIGLSDPFAITMRHAELPCYVDTVLIPFKGRIIYDSMVRDHRILFGPGYRSSFTGSYNKAKERCGITETLTGDASSGKKGPPEDGTEKRTEKKAEAKKTAPKNNISVNLATLETIARNADIVKSGIKIHEAGTAICKQTEDGFSVRTEDKDGKHTGFVRFKRDGLDIEDFVCNCNVGNKDLLCEHIVAGVLTIQGGIPDSKIVLGWSAAAEISVDEGDTARSLFTGNYDMFALSAMSLLMEKAAHLVMEDVLEKGKIALAAGIITEATAIAPFPGSKLTVTASIATVRGRDIRLVASVRDDFEELAKGAVFRIVVNEEEFLKRVKEKRKGQK